MALSKDDILNAIRLMRAYDAVLGTKDVVAYESAGFSSKADILEYNEPLGKVKIFLEKLSNRKSSARQYTESMI